jgi:hypothetical protein
LLFDIFAYLKNFTILFFIPQKIIYNLSREAVLQFLCKKKIQTNKKSNNDYAFNHVTTRSWVGVICSSRLVSRALPQISSTTFIFFHIGINTHCHRAAITDIVTPLFEQLHAPSIVKFESIIFWYVVNAGCLGVGRCACSLLIIETTSGMVGRSVGLSWTQRRPMLMNLNRTEVEEGYPIVGSINSKLRSSIHSSQA